MSLEKLCVHPVELPTLGKSNLMLASPANTLYPTSILQFYNLLVLLLYNIDWSPFTSITNMFYFNIPIMFTFVSVLFPLHYHAYSYFYHTFYTDFLLASLSFVI